MDYWHGSNVLFEQFDLSKGVICLTPHIDYAKNYAKKKVIENGGKEYLYRVSVKGDENLIYNSNMLNISFRSIENLTIKEIIEL